MRGQNKTVIIAIDNPDQRRWCVETLIESGCRIFEATELIHIADLLYRYRINIIISNPDLKNVPLYELLPLLKRFYKDTKVIMFMKDYSPEKELILRLNGVSNTIPWPVSRELLVSLVNKVNIKSEAYAF